MWLSTHDTNAHKIAHNLVVPHPAASLDRPTNAHGVEKDVFGTHAFPQLYLFAATSCCRSKRPCTYLSQVVVESHLRRSTFETFYRHATTGTRLLLEKTKMEKKKKKKKKQKKKTSSRLYQNVTQHEKETAYTYP
jgi:hypothetical protein